MIDEKKIEKATQRYSNVTNANKIEASLLSEGFKEGIHWFKKSLWHDASEEPREDSECIINTRLGYYIRYWNAIDKCWDDEEGDDYFCEMSEVKRWMYLNDILPQQGGEQ